MPVVRRRHVLPLAVLALVVLLSLRVFRSQRKVTVIVASQGLHPVWLLKTLQAFTAREYGELVDQVILVWNADRQLPPIVPGVTVLAASAVNSPKNRWVHTLPYIRTDAVLNLDEDVSVSPAGVACMLKYWSAEPWRLVGPFVRRTKDEEYVADELIKVPGEAYSIVLPRVLMLSKSHLVEYAAPEFQELREYVDSDEAHSDDLLLNLVAAHLSPYPPLRVALPEKSVSDYGTICSPLDRELSGGLANHASRGRRRSKSLSTLMTSLPGIFLDETNEVAMCELGQRARVFSSSVPIRRWRNMDVGDSRVLCPELKLTPPPERSGPGEELQLYCPEVDASVTAWIDSLERNPICGDSRAGSTARTALLDSAMHQCAASCIWDMRTDDPVGWFRTPECFQRYDSAVHPCQKQIHERPKYNLPLPLP